MPTSSSYPTIGQSVQVIAVQGGHIHIAQATVATSAADAIAITLQDEEMGSHIDAATRVTLNYLQGDCTWRLKASPLSEMKGGAVALQPLGEPARGEQRDFIRADVEVHHFLGALSGTDLDTARKSQEQTSLSLDNAAWRLGMVDLSGNGARFPWAGSWKRGDLVDFRVRLPVGDTEEILAILARIIRVGGRGGPEDVILNFEEIDDFTQDQLFEYVSGQYHAQIHIALAKAMGGEQSS
jgi:hypothetical protein